MILKQMGRRTSYPRRLNLQHTCVDHIKLFLMLADLKRSHTFCKIVAIDSGIRYNISIQQSLRGTDVSAILRTSILLTDQCLRRGVDFVGAQCRGVVVYMPAFALQPIAKVCRRSRPGKEFQPANSRDISRKICQSHAVYLLFSSTLLAPSTINLCSASWILSCNASSVSHPSMLTSCCTIGSPMSTSVIT